MGSVYGGGQDGHVRRSTNVTINQAEIGIAYSDANIAKLDKDKLTDLQWKGRGNVFGAGSGIGSYTVKDPSNGQPIKSLVPDKKGNYPDSIDYNYSSGSVTCNTNVIINEKSAGKTIIHQNVYGGGSLASIGPPNTGQGFAEFNTTDNYDRTPAEHLSTSSNNVIVNGGTIGDATSYAAGYGGNIFGASRGNLNNELNLGETANRYATSLWTDVKVNQGHVLGNVFGGGESGAVTKDTKVTIGGEVEGSNAAQQNNNPTPDPDPNQDPQGGIQRRSSATNGQTNAARETLQNRSTGRNQATR